MQFITFRLAGSFPGERLEVWKRELRDLPDEAAELRRRIEAYLYEGYGEAWLSDPRVAKVVEDALSYFDGERYRLHAWMVMPNHVHALITPQPGNSVSDIVHSWKSFTGKKANRLLGRSGPFWQEDYFDRYIRDQRHFDATLKYVQQNPVKANLCRQPQDYPFLGPPIQGPPDPEPCTQGPSTLGPRASSSQPPQFTADVRA